MKGYKLSDLQIAYLLARDAQIPLGNTPCHVYMEFDGSDVDNARLQRAWSSLFRRHLALRARFHADGRMDFLDDGLDHIDIVDYRECDEEVYNRELQILRDRLSHRKLAVSEGEVTSLTLAQLPNGKARLIFELDLLVCDVRSFQVVLRDLADAYHRENIDEASVWNPECHERAMRIDADVRKSARAYWEEKAQKMPEAPVLLLQSDPASIEAVRFTSFSELLPQTTWKSLQYETERRGADSFCLLLAVFIAVMAMRSDSQEFLLNIPIFERPESEGVEDAVADFSKLILFSAKFKEDMTFAALLAETERRFSMDNRHIAGGGVSLIGRLATQRKGAVAPVVFAPSLHLPLLSDTFHSYFGRLNFMISQTPQVWLDAQFFEFEGGLMLSFVEADGLFAYGWTQQTLTDCAELLFALAERSEHWDERPEELLSTGIFREG